jgi:hypothetical protein
VYGGGFIKDMIAVTKNNRSLVKGDSSATYKSFDKSYITAYRTGKSKPVKVVPADQKLLEKIKLSLVEEEKLVKQKRYQIMAVTVFLSISIGFYFVFFY